VALDTSISSFSAHLNLKNVFPTNQEFIDVAIYYYVRDSGALNKLITDIFFEAIKKFEEKTLWSLKHWYLDYSLMILNCGQLFIQYPSFKMVQCWEDFRDSVRYSGTRDISSILFADSSLGRSQNIFNCHTSCLHVHELF